jgi:hypothetical protein
VSLLGTLPIPERIAGQGAVSPAEDPVFPGGIGVFATRKNNRAIPGGIGSAAFHEGELRSSVGPTRVRVWGVQKVQKPGGAGVT